MKENRLIFNSEKPTGVEEVETTTGKPEVRPEDIERVEGQAVVAKEIREQADIQQKEDAEAADKVLQEGLNKISTAEKQVQGILERIATGQSVSGGAVDTLFAKYMDSVSDRKEWEKRFAQAITKNSGPINADAFMGFLTNMDDIPEAMKDNMIKAKVDFIATQAYNNGDLSEDDIRTLFLLSKNREYLRHNFLIIAETIKPENKDSKLAVEQIAGKLQGETEKIPAVENTESNLTKAQTRLNRIIELVKENNLISTGAINDLLAYREILGPDPLLTILKENKGSISLEGVSTVIDAIYEKVSRLPRGNLEIRNIVEKQIKAGCEGKKENEGIPHELLKFAINHIEFIPPNNILEKACNPVQKVALQATII